MVIPSIRARVIALALPAATLLLSACGTAGPQNTFDQQSDFARMVMGLFSQIIWWAIAVFVVVEAILVFTIIRFRQRPNDARPPQIHGNTKLEIAWTIAPALVLASISVPTVGTIFKTYEVPSGPTINTVEVIGHQFWWEYRLPGAGTQPIVTANDLHVPVGRTTVLKITAADVIHSYWIPKLGVKRDAIPGHVNTIWFTPDRETPTGDDPSYLGQCAEFCGAQHTNMRLRVIVDSLQKFDQWVKDTSAPVTITSSSAATFAKYFYDSSKQGAAGIGLCGGCHNVGTLVPERADGTAKSGPNLAHLASRVSLAGAIMDNNEQNLRRWLSNPQDVKPGNKMVIGTLPPDDLNALVALLQSLK